MGKVTDRHPLYEKWVSKWSRQRDAIEGEDRIKERGDLYLPRLDGQSALLNGGAIVRDEHGNVTTLRVSSYESYKDRASFMNATGRTVESLSGAIMRKDATLDWPNAEDKFLDTAGYCGESFEEVKQEVLDEVIGIGRFGHLVDAVANPDQQADPVEPYIAPYFAENITNWDDQVINNRRVVTMVTLLEKMTVQNSTTGKMESRDRYRVLRLGIPVPQSEEEGKMGPEEFLGTYGLSVAQATQNGPTGFYYQEIWDQVETSEGKEAEFERTAVYVPKLPGGALLDEIPWTFFGPQSTKADPQKPPLMDLTIVNVSLYRNSADLEHGLHFTALPQPWAAGFKFKGELVIGSGVAWLSDDPQAQCGYMEFTGEGLKAISEQMDRKKKEMAVLGARLLEEQSPAGAAEAVQTVKMRHAGEHSVLSRISLAVSEGLTRSLRFLARFKGVTDPEGVSIVLNLDFGTAGLDSAMLVALMQQVQAGLMSWNTYFANLKKGEIIPDDVDEEEESRRIEAGRPTDPNAILAPNAPGGPQSADGNNPPANDKQNPQDKPAEKPPVDKGAKG